MKNKLEDPMKKALSTALMLSLACGFFSCEDQGKGHEKKKPYHHKKQERPHPRRGVVSQQSEVNTQDMK